ncbi:MAG: hypothetical protein FWE52_04300 [Alphaproteobacteria bacterium]|nr:hypothetical protein [Alphaproteobacteria bacterium]
MFGISMAEFLIILVVAIAVIPAKDWPAVARFLARSVKFIRDLIWKISDSADKIREQIDLEKPIDELSKQTMNDVMDAFRVPMKKTKSKKAKK